MPPDPRPLSRVSDPVKQIKIISELYYPEQNATGYFLTGIAEGLAEGGADVSVICAQPGYNSRGTKAPKSEVSKGVSIRRCWSTTFDHRKILGRLVNFVTTSISLGWRALLTVRQGDSVLVVTNPPLLPFLVRVVCGLKRARFLLLVHDVYPDVFVAAGLLKGNSWLYKLLDLPNRLLLRSSHQVIVLGRDMRDLLAAKLPERQRGTVRIIPNWAMDEVVAEESGESLSLVENMGLAEDSFLLVYNGNHGRTHFLEVWLAVAKAVADDRRFQFVFAGEGSGKARFERECDASGVKNVHRLSFVPRQELVPLLHSADLLLLSFCPGMAGVSVPSRIYNLMAAGRPILAVADQHSEVTQVLQEEDCGWSFDAKEESEETAATIGNLLRQLIENRSVLTAKGENGRKAVLEKYTREMVIEKYREVFQ